MVRFYVAQAKEEIGPPFLELAAAKVLSDYALMEMLGVEKEDEEGSGTDKNAKFVDTVKQFLEISPSGYGGMPTPEVKKVQEVLETSSMELRAMVQDPLENMSHGPVVGDPNKVDVNDPSCSVDRSANALQANDGDLDNGSCTDQNNGSKFTPMAPNNTVQTIEDELGNIQMKAHDLQRALHSHTLQKGENLRSDQPNTNLSSVQGIKCKLKQVDLLGKKSVPSPPITPQDVARQSTKNTRVDVAQQSTKKMQVDIEHLFEGCNDQQKAAIKRERARRIEEQKKMLAARKLCLVLDLDHTLLNSSSFAKSGPHDEMLKKKEKHDSEKPQKHLFRLPHLGMWTKLRPGIWNFLEKASKLYELHLYTMGTKDYATEMVRLLDPEGVLFKGRVFSRVNDAEVPETKDLDGVLGMESAVVIIDDTVRVWPYNKLNLIVVERYIYFPCSMRLFGYQGPSLLEIDHDERPEDGALSTSLAVIERIHHNFFLQQSFGNADVRHILASEQRKILGGCRILFSRVIPVGEANPQLHPLWQTAEQFGAVCTNQRDKRVTHVVANSIGNYMTDKVKWALAKRKFVVHPGWVEASALHYQRANEQDFAIKQILITIPSPATNMPPESTYQAITNLPT